MRDFLSGTDVAITFRYGDAQQPTIPTVGSVTYTVLDHYGVPITGLVDLPVTTGATTFESTIIVPDTYNDVEVGKNFSRRSVVVSYEAAGAPRSQTVQYRLTPTIPYTVTIDSVRSFIGIEAKDLPDSEIDLYQAYLLTANDFTAAVLDSALTSGTLLEVYANDCVRMQAVFGVIQSLKNRIAQSEKNGIMGFDRPKIVDFSEIYEAARLRYNNGLLALLDINLSATDFTLIVTTQDADPVTGA